MRYRARRQEQYLLRNGVLMPGPASVYVGEEVIQSGLAAGSHIVSGHADLGKDTLSHPVPKSDKRGPVTSTIVILDLRRTEGRIFP